MQLAMVNAQRRSLDESTSLTRSHLRLTQSRYAVILKSPSGFSPRLHLNNVNRDRGQQVWLLRQMGDKCSKDMARLL